MDTELKADIKEIKESLKTLNGRVRSVENWRWMMTGGITILSIIIVPVVLLLVQRSL